jgi:acetyltransferase-like isoleucine patch superfamily enzyme
MTLILRILREKLFKFIHRNNGNIVVGPGLRLQCWLSIKGPGRVEIGENCAVSAIAGSRVKLVTLYTHSPDAVLQVEDNVQLIAARISCKFSISIGNNVIIEDASILDTDFHTLDISRKTPSNENVETCRIVIEEGVAIGSRAIITKGVTLGRKACIYPGAVVQKSFPAFSQIIGNPAKIIKKAVG